MLTKQQIQEMIDLEIANKNLPRSIKRAKVAEIMHHICTSCYAEPMDAFLTAGQSNARGKGNSAQAPDPQAETVYQHGNPNLSVVTNDVGFTEGSFMPAMGITWYQMTRRRICFANRATDSTSLSPLVNNSGQGDWSPAGQHFQPSITATNSMIVQIDAAGFIPVFRGVIWGLGESDAAGINAGLTTKSAFKDQLRELISGYRSVYGADMPFYMIKTGTRTDQNDTGYSEIRDAQDEIVAEDPHRNKFIYKNTFGFIARGMMRDVVHYNQAAQNEIGREGAAVILGGKDPK
jgi:hypothetical protein